MFRRGATALAPVHLRRAFNARSRAVLGGGLGGGLPSPAPALAPATTLRALGSRPLPDGGPLSATPVPTGTAPPPPPATEFPEVQQVAATSTNNYILYALNNMRVEILAEQRKIVEGNSAVLQEVKDLRKDLITGRDFLGESQKVMEASLKVHEQVKDTRADMKSELVTESRKILDFTVKVSDEVKELRTEIKSNIADFKIFIGKMIVNMLLGLGALLLGAISIAWPYILEFLVFLKDKWETLAKPKGN